jgi:hypothetical protein
MTLSAEQARNIFNAVIGMAGPTQALFEAQAADAMGDLTEADLIAVMEDYVAAKQSLDNALTTRGII